MILKVYLALYILNIHFKIYIYYLLRTFLKFFKFKNRKCNKRDWKYESIKRGSFIIIIIRLILIYIKIFMKFLIFQPTTLFYLCLFSHNNLLTVIQNFSTCWLGEIRPLYSCHISNFPCELKTYMANLKYFWKTWPS